MDALMKQWTPNLYLYRDKFIQSLQATFEMFWKAGSIAFVIGLFFGILLVVTKKDGISKNRPVYQVTNLLINIFRSIPFVILLIFLIPFTRALMRTAIGVRRHYPAIRHGAFYTRQVEVALSSVAPARLKPHVP